jgi:hypothetical protein
VVALIDEVIQNFEDAAVLASVSEKVNDLMHGRDLFNA